MPWTCRHRWDITRTTRWRIGPIFAAIVIAMARRQGVDPRSIHLFFQNDVLKECIARGTYIYPPGPVPSINWRVQVASGPSVLMCGLIWTDSVARFRTFG